MRQIKYILLSLSMLTLLSCQHKELCYNHVHGSSTLRIQFDWQHVPTATPGSMAVYLFPIQGGEVLRYDLTNLDGGEIKCNSGDYKILCVNSDTRNVQFRNTGSWDTFEAYTKDVNVLNTLGVRAETLPKAEGAEGERDAIAPDSLLYDSGRQISIIESGTDNIITLSPRSAVYNYTIEIDNAENMEYVTSLSGSMSGMSESFLISQGKVGESKITIPFEMKIESDKTTLTGEFLTFGHCPTQNNNHFITVYAIMANDSKWYYTYDVTDQIHNTTDTKNVHIVLTGLPLPKPDMGGFQPNITEWENAERIDLNM